MNAKYIADELIDKMYYVGRYDDKEDYNPAMAWERAKQCALIAVDELIIEQTMWQNGEVNPILYWQEVKTEIEKL
jgi:hypothetical protein